ncbi:uncharacterized protein [Amphiura filiformis]|uniref:uncharacterized protein n=1 Tax=Amphiura filiformis TaxID=82378 RepID=UPI003B224232
MELANVFLMLLLNGLAVNAVHEALTCDSSTGWYTYEDHCYKLLVDPYQSADDASAACEGLLAHGVPSQAYISITECPSELEWITSTLLNPITQIWLGCRNDPPLFEQFCCDANNDGYCEHSEATGYWPWGDGQQIIDRECLTLENGELHKSDCVSDAAPHVVCEYPLYQDGLHAPEPLFPFGNAVDDVTLPREDDITVSIPLPEPFKYYGVSYNGPSEALHISENGVVTVGIGVSTYVAEEFPIFAVPIIAPFWSDIDTTKSGQVTYRSIGIGTPNTRSDNLEIFDDIDEMACKTDSELGFTADWLFIATWRNVAFEESTAYCELKEKGRSLDGMV